MRWRLLCCALSLVATGVLKAQVAESGIDGDVRDEAGAAVLDATVTVRNESTGNSWRVRANATGRFTLVQLPLGGPYTVEARALGYEPGAQRAITLRLGVRAAVHLRLQRTSQQLSAVRVDAEAPVRDAATGANRRIDATTLAAVPALGRNFTDLAALSSTSGPQLSLFGQRWTSTDIRIDGAQARNMLRAGEFGAGPFTLSLEAIREFDISTAVFDVAQGRQGGGAIRAVTRAGTNDWSGSVFSYYRGSTLSAPSDFQSRTRAQREFNAVQWGASIGGPLVRDKLHVFFALDRQDSNEPVFTGLIQTPADERSIGIAPDSLARALQVLSRVYGLDTSRAQVGRLDRRPWANTAFTRVDWKPSATHALTLTHNLNAWHSPLSGGVDLPVALFEARSDYESLEQQATLRLRSTALSGLQNEASLTFSHSERTLDPVSNLPRGFLRIQSRLSDGSAGDTRVQFGGNRLAPDDSRETQWQWSDRLTMPRGNVVYAVGTDNALTSLNTYIAESQGGLFEFQSIADLEARRAFRYSRTVPLIESAPTTHQQVIELAAYAQADWRVNRALSLQAGLRWDAIDFLTAAPRNPLVEQVLNERTDRAPSDWKKAQPRVQLTWESRDNRDRDGRDLVRIGAGRFAAEPIFYLQHNQLLNDGRRIADITRTGSAVPVPDFIGYRTGTAVVPGIGGASAPAPYVNLVGEQFETPSVWKANATWRHRIGSHLSLTGTLLATRTTSNYMYLDRNLRSTAAFTLDNEDARPVFVPATTIDAAGRTLNTNALADARLGRVLELTSTGRATSRTAIIDAAWRMTADASFDVSYTRNSARDNSTFGCCLGRTATTFTAITGDPRSLNTSWGPSDLDFRHKLVISTVLPRVWGIRVGARYVASSGRPFSAIVNGDINGDEATSNDLAFIFDPDNPSTPAAVAASMRKVLDNPHNVAREYLRANLGRIATRNGAVVPWSGRADVRFERDFATRRGQSLALSLDIFNVANLLNSSWGGEYQLPVGISNQNPVVQRVPLLNVVGFNQSTRQYTYTVNENFGVLQKAGAPYQMQLALRYRY